MNYMEAIALIVGVMLFLWASAVIAAGLSFLVTDGRLGRREWCQVTFATLIIVACVVGFVVLDMGSTLPPPESDTAPPDP